MTYTIIPTTATVSDDGKSKLYLIDIDGTLVTSASGRRWAADQNDWIFLGPVPATLNKLHDDGWIVALITNQSDWKSGPEPEAKIKSILAALQEINGWAPWCLIATATRKEKDTLYRKPGRGLYDLLIKELPPLTEVRMCGDAVGPTDPYPPYRWADSDSGFASAISATFVRPCELLPPGPVILPVEKQELILLMGNPGSGKSTLGRNLASCGYIHVEQDTLTSKAATKKAAISALATGLSVVVDATHGSFTNREPYLTLGVPVRIIWCIRDGRPFNALREEPVPEVAYAVYSKHFVRPAEDVTIIY
jgi:bifunctional polynucleotide phosphatase/kinase